MEKIKYSLSSFWMAPNIPYLLKKEDYEEMLEEVKECQNELSRELSDFDLTTNEGHESLMSAVKVSLQLRNYRQNVEARINYWINPVNQGVNTFEVYTAPRAHEQEQARGKKL